MTDAPKDSKYTGSSSSSSGASGGATDRQKSIDGLKKSELQAAGGEQYPYLDQTRDLHVPLGGQGDGLSSAVLNPAYYPKNVKPEILHTEAEKAGADFPEGPTPDDVQDESKKSSDFGLTVSDELRMAEMKRLGLEETAKK